MGDDIIKLVDALEKKAFGLAQEMTLNQARSNAQGQVQLIAIEGARKGFDYARERLDRVLEKMVEIELMVKNHVEQCERCADGRMAGNREQGGAESV